MSGNRRQLYLLIIGIILCRINAKKQDEEPVSTPTSHVQEDFEQNRKFLSSLPTAYEIVYPVQLRKNEEQGLSTRDFYGRHKHLHYHHTTIQFTAFGRKLKIRLDLNKELLSKGIKQKRHVDETTQMISEALVFADNHSMEHLPDFPHENHHYNSNHHIRHYHRYFYFHLLDDVDNPIEHCYYKGRVRKMEGESLVAISTCDGIRGIIQVRNESYVIQPLTMIHDGNYTRHPHVVYRAVPVERRECANGRGTWRPYEELHKAEFLRKLKITKAQQSDRNVVEDIKYLETALVMDYSIYKRFNYSYSATLQYALQLGNMIDAYLQDLKIQVQLVLVDIWNMKEEFDVHSDARWTLHNFFKYRHKTLRAVPYHVAQFITSKRFDNGEVGMCVPDSICSTRAVGVSMDPEPLDPQPTVSNAVHMIGHMLGMQHDKHDACECSDAQGCLMEETRGGRREHTWTFSTCSQQDLNKTLLSGLGACLFENPFEPSYEGICGDKKLDRGEECDCGSPEECEIWEPCCDPTTCMLRPWATCTGGPCCYNCTVLPQTHKCRSAHGECDIPEFCDGLTGQCPVDDIVSDGEQCNEGESFCYRGLCHSYDDQCTMLWGQDASQADDKCYEKFNSAGNFNGHCGQLSEDNYRKCEIENLKCGLLHCTGGDDEPIVDVKTNAVSSSVDYDGHRFQCKIVNSAAGTILTLGMVEDGTRCGDGRMCLNYTCITVADYFWNTCPEGPNNRTCSGNGKCTSTGNCYCHRGYAGDDCSIVKIPTTSTVLPTTTEEESNDTGIDFAIYGPEDKSIDVPAATTTEDIPVLVASEGSKTTQWLMIVLASVAGGALLLFGLSMLCYRRRSPMRLQKMNKRKMWLSKVMGSSRHSHKSDSSNGDDIPRLISFGNMPSYRADKRKKHLRRSGVPSETGSEHSQNSARQSTEIRAPTSLTIAAPPEKGILKKQGARSTETLPLKSMACGSGEPSYCAISDSPYVASLESEYMAIGEPPYRPQDYRDRPMEVDGATQTSPMTPTDNGDDSGSSYSDEAKEVLSPSDYDDLDDDEKDPEDFRRLWEGEDERPHSGSGSDGHKSESPPPYSNKPPSRASSSNGSRSSSGSGSGSGSSSGAESSRAKRLKDLDEIMRQIDEQAKRLVEAREKDSQDRSSPPGATSSPRPGNSAVRDRPKRSPPYVATGGRDRSSDTEADRLLPRGGFYKQTDAETGQVEDVCIASPTSPKAEVMYLPNIKPSNHKSYSPLQIEIPNRPQSGKSASPPRSLSPRGKHNHSQPVPPSKRELYSPRKLSPNGAKSKPAQLTSPSYQVESPTSPLSPMSDSKCIPEMPQITPRRIGQNPAFTQGNYGLYQNLPPPVSPRKTLLGHNGKREKSPLSRIDHEKLMARGSPLSSTSSSENSEIFTRSPGAASPPRKNTQQHSPPPNTSVDTLSAIPYRGVKTGDSSLPCSPPTTPRKSKQDQSANSSAGSVGQSPAQRRSNKTTPEPPPRNLAISGNKLTHPLLDGYPFRRNSLTADGGHSTSEGYHSDRADTDIDAIVIREIPIKTKRNPEPPLSPNHRQSYHEATSPDYVEM